MEIKAEILIERDLKTTFEAFRDIEGWQDVLDDVVGVNVFYDDGLNQLFEMTVERPAGHETVRTIRFCYPNRAIELFQTVPPPYFTKMSGKWTFEEKNGQTLVTASRRFELKPDIQNFNSGNLLNFLNINLQSFKNHLEAACGKLT